MKINVGRKNNTYLNVNNYNTVSYNKILTEDLIMKTVFVHCHISKYVTAHLQAESLGLDSRFVSFQ